jgi:hypothetical protein
MPSIWDKARATAHNSSSAVGEPLAAEHSLLGANISILKAQFQPGWEADMSACPDKLAFYYDPDGRIHAYRLKPTHEFVAITSSPQQAIVDLMDKDVSNIKHTIFSRHSFVCVASLENGCFILAAHNFPQFKPFSANKILSDFLFWSHIPAKSM